jgi:hypothetical protein
MIVDNNDWCCCPSHSSNFLLFWDFLSFPAHRADQFPNSDSDSAVRCSENCWSSVLCMKSWLPNIFIYIILYLHIYLVVINIYMFICANTTILCREIYLYFQHYLPHVCWSPLERPKASLFWQFRWGHLVMRTLFGVKCFFTDNLPDPSGHQR